MLRPKEESGGDVDGAGQRPVGPAAAGPLVAEVGGSLRPARRAGGQRGRPAARPRPARWTTTQWQAASDLLLLGPLRTGPGGAAADGRARLRPGRVRDLDRGAAAAARPGRVGGAARGGHRRGQAAVPRVRRAGRHGQLRRARRDRRPSGAGEILASRARAAGADLRRRSTRRTPRRPGRPGRDGRTRSPRPIGVPGLGERAATSTGPC